MKKTFLYLIVLSFVTLYSCGGCCKKEVTEEEANTYVDSVSNAVENSAQDLEEDVNAVDNEVDSLLNELN